MEKRDLYDENRIKMGKSICIDEEIPNKNYIITVVIFIEDKEGNFLIQKRSVSKGGKWATTAGHAKVNETSKQAIITEVKEEIGLDISKEELVLYNSIRDEVTRSFWDFYYVKMEYDINNLIIQKEEVTDVKKATKEEILNLIHSNEFSKGHAYIFKEFLKLKIRR